MPRELVERRTRLAARLLLKAADGPLRGRDALTAQRLAELEICEDSLYEKVFADLGRQRFRPWQTPSLAKELWKTLGGRPKLDAVRSKTSRAHSEPISRASDDWFFAAEPTR